MKATSCALSNSRAIAYHIQKMESFMFRLGTIAMRYAITRHLKLYRLSLCILSWSQMKCYP